MSERRKRLHNERAAKHQAGLRAKLAAEKSTTVQNAKPDSLHEDECKSATNLDNVAKFPGYEETNIISSWSTAFNTQDNVHCLTYESTVGSKVCKLRNWTDCRLMQKLKTRSFPPNIQQVMDTKYKYYNPFEYLNSYKAYGGFHESDKPVFKATYTKDLGTYNVSYSHLFKHWKPHFVSSLSDKMPGYRLLWLTSYTLHVVALKIFSMFEEDMTDVMYNIGECLVAKSIYISRSDIENKAQYENDRKNRNNDCIHVGIDTFTYKLDSYFFPEFRYLSGIIAEKYCVRARDLNSRFLLSSSEFGQLCFGRKNDSVSRCFFGNEASLFHFRKEALETTFAYIDTDIAEYPFDVDGFHSDNQFDDDDSCASRSHWFVGGDEKPLGMHRNRLKEMLFVLQFSGFESTLKCPCSRVYSDLTFLFGCPLAEDKCKNQAFNTVSALLQHFNSKICIFHTVLSKYLSTLCEISGIDSLPVSKRNKASRM